MSTDRKSKDIVEEVFSRIMNVDERESALFNLGRVPSLDRADGPSELENSSASEETGNSPSVPPQTVKAVEDVNRSKVNNLGPRHKAVMIATVVLILSGLSFFSGRYFLQDGNASTKIISEQQYANRSEVVRQQHTIVVADSEAEVVEPETAGKMASEETADMDLKPTINWGHLLSDISAKIPTEMHLSIIESTDGSEMVLEGAALESDSIYNFVRSLNTNGQIRLAELDGAGIEQADSHGLLTFSIRCFLAPNTEMTGSADIFGLQEAKEFFAGIETVCQSSNCQVRSLVISPKDATIEDGKISSRITKKEATVMLTGGYRDILKVIRQLQADRQGIWFDYVIIENVSGDGKLECRLDISIYVTDSA